MIWGEDNFPKCDALLTLGAHVHEGYGSLFVCLSVCYQSTDCLRGLHSEMNIPADVLLNAQDFQPRDFFEKLSVKSYSLFLLFCNFKSAIFFRIPTNTMRILGCTRSAKYSCLTLL